MHDMPTCVIKKGSSLVNIMFNSLAFIVDEASMTHSSVYEAIDRALQDIKGNTHSFSGISTLLYGDFRQILQVVKNGIQANIIDASL